MAGPVVKLTQSSLNEHNREWDALANATPVIHKSTHQVLMPSSIMRRSEEAAECDQEIGNKGKLLKVRIDDNIPVIRTIYTKNRWCREGKWDKFTWDFPWRPVKRPSTKSNISVNDPNFWQNLSRLA